MKPISESDWKRFKVVRDDALQRYCERVLLDMQSLISDTTRSAHERYLAIYGLIEDRDDMLARLFNDFRRSTAVVQLIGMVNQKLISDSEIASFSDEVNNLFKLSSNTDPE
jgi:hypothetical protein